MDTATSTDDKHSFEALVTLAHKSDKIVIGLNENGHSGEHNSNMVCNLALDAHQVVLFKHLAATEVAGIASAVTMTYLPDIHGGLSIAQVLYGQSSLSGCFPFTYPQHEYQAKDTIWQSQSAEYALKLPFNFGLGYSQMVYSNLTVDSTELRPGKPITVRMTVCNAGTFDQHDPIMLYTAQRFCTGYELELFHLRKFDKVEIKAETAKSI
ncbi:hypothetical protein LPJ66_000924 [Kickxella alabastrina]|uniref:Uncharacterized protein n=1 Tax=Kickxella alabastrina TaxID=61397 RepID=A0ACC1IUZ9_9FUNG|nr:hypothetical protein LPJ66_000924 [Kickxella alabastrina]